MSFLVVKDVVMRAKMASVRKDFMKLVSDREYSPSAWTLDKNRHMELLTEVKKLSGLPPLWRRGKGEFLWAA